ncbi:uncharacterized protein LOC133191431 [Saccostrea echinata]|uniref:uncharacterized protein LOC133191431 n=1 Tax=Saccostrea echinata TaxID=191078 RepID=UPI002A81D797|nr:uncharacterized protein LOC133191431 [Saccostrea echinata]
MYSNMLEIWEFVLILFGAEALVGIGVGIFIWRKHKTNTEYSSQRDLLDELQEDVILNDLYEADDLEIGVPPHDYKEVNDNVQLKAFRRLSSISDFRESKSGESQMRRTSILSEVALPDVEPRPMPMVLATDDDVFYGSGRPLSDMRPPSYHTRMSYAHSIGEDLTPVNSPSPTRFRKTLVIDESTKGGLSRPKMGDPLPFSLHSEKTDVSMEVMDKAKPLWDI